jgi:anthranilate phosphoribosyltransferase
MTLAPFPELLQAVCNRENLTPAKAQEAMEQILAGSVTTAQIAGFLVALRMKGETADELFGFARAMRARCVAVDVGLPGEPLLDNCGTGGDGAGTFNISTVVSFVVAGAGVRVAKHGNRSISSRCGSADILEALGVVVEQSPERVAEAIREIGVGFLYAPAFHPALRYAGAARSELKMRTAFNLLGPLCHPANANVQLVGAPSRHAAELVAQTLALLGLKRGFVVHGFDGLDEISTTGKTMVYEIHNGAIAERTLEPADFGVRRARLDDLRGGDKDTNAAIAREILAGMPGPRRDIVLVNAAAALLVAGKAPDLEAGMAQAAESIDSGSAAAKLQQFASFSLGQP